ncbi:MAG TPA: DUF4013 domain-containing protein [Roseiflexaceae bacterium]|nr:DUF4013 domain-containing protein [Roseiflexaceae bacterium]
MLRTAIANIHNDRLWWRKILIGGALSLTIFGYPWAAGLVVESLDNTQKGFPTPLPPWREWFARYVAGLFAVLIDFVFFVLPILAAGLLLFCVAVAVLLADGPSAWLVPVSALGVLYELAMFAIGVSPIGRLLYVENGHAEEALGWGTVRQALRPNARRIYARARLLSLPAYLPMLLFVALVWVVGGSGLPGAQLLIAVLLWLAASALLYAHLVVAQLYAMAERSARYI